MRWIKQRLSEVGEIPFVVVIGWIVRTLVWAGTMFTAFQAWARFRFQGKWPLPGGVLSSIRSDPLWFSAFMIFALAALLNNKFTRRPKKSVAGDERRSNYQEMAAHRMRDDVKPRSRDHKPAWEMWLRAAEHEIEAALGISGKQLIQTNLLLVKNPGEISIVARSQLGPCPKTYPLQPGRMASLAIVENRTVVQCNVRSVPGFQHKAYDCVAATPIALHIQSFGAITVDSKDADTFKGQESVIDRILRPYCAIILLTLGEDADYHECPERNAR
jgi:hypothetical protein